MSFGKPKSIAPPALPEPVATPTPTTIQAQKAGRTERVRTSRGRASTRFTTPGMMAPAPVERKGLKTTFG